VTNVGLAIGPRPRCAGPACGRNWLVQPMPAEHMHGQSPRPELMRPMGVGWWLPCSEVVEVSTGEGRASCQARKEGSGGH
jgi:hypothetical protein